MVLEMTLSVQVSSCPYAACGPVCGVSRTSLDSRTPPCQLCAPGDRLGAVNSGKAVAGMGPMSLCTM